jgi:hypothetical protein
VSREGTRLIEERRNLLKKESNSPSPNIGFGGRKLSNREFLISEFMRNIDTLKGTPVLKKIKEEIRNEDSTEQAK